MAYPSNSDLSDEEIASYVSFLESLERTLDEAQQDKKDFFEETREARGKDFVAALKLAVKTGRMDADKRTKAEEIDAFAERILGVMRKGLHLRVARGARAREIIEEFPAGSAETDRLKIEPIPQHDPETGELLDDNDVRPNDSVNTDDEASHAPSSVPNSDHSGKKVDQSTAARKDGLSTDDADGSPSSIMVLARAGLGNPLRRRETLPTPSLTTINFSAHRALGSAVTPPPPSLKRGSSAPPIFSAAA